MEESISHMVEGLLHESAPVAVPAHTAATPARYGMETPTPTPPTDSAFATPPSTAAELRRRQDDGDAATNSAVAELQKIDFHSEPASKSSQELLNHLNNVLASIPSNAPPTPITPNNLHELVQQQQQRQQEQQEQQQLEQQQEDEAKFNQSRAEFFRFDPALTPFVEKSYEVLRGNRRLSFGETPDTAALAEQLLRHREQQQNQGPLGADTDLSLASADLSLASADLSLASEELSLARAEMSCENSKANSSFFNQSPADFSGSSQSQIDGSLLVDGLNQFAMSHCRSASFDSSLYQPGSDPNSADEAKEQPQMVPSSVSLSSTMGGVGTVDKPPFFSTPYPKSEAKISAVSSEPCFSLAAILEDEVVSSSSTSSHRFRPTAEEFKPTTVNSAGSRVAKMLGGGGVGGGGGERPDTPAPFSVDKSFNLPMSSSSRVSLLTSTSGYVSGRSSSCSLSSPSPAPSDPTNENQIGNGNDSSGNNNNKNSADYEDRPKNARERAAYLLEQERDLIHNMSAASLEQLRQAYAAAPVSSESGNGAGSCGFFAAGSGGGGGDVLLKSDDDPMESSGESFASSGVHSDASGVASSASGDLTHLCDFVEKLQQQQQQQNQQRGSSSSRDESTGATSASSPLHVTVHQQQQQQSAGEDVFQRLLKQIPLNDSPLPPPPIFHPHVAPASIAATGNQAPPPPSVNQLTSMLRQRIMPPSPLTLHPGSAHSGFADGFAAAAAALTAGSGAAAGRVGPSVLPFSPNNLVARRSVAPHHHANHHAHPHHANHQLGNHQRCNSPHGNHPHCNTQHGNHHQRGLHHFSPSPLLTPQSPFRYPPPPGSPYGHNNNNNSSGPLDLVPYDNNSTSGGYGGGGALDWPLSPNELFATSPDDPYSIERAARLYRNAATICDATIIWGRPLPPRIYRNPIYSCKVFIGGVPWDITEIGLLNTFKCYGNLRIEWPGKDGKHPKYPPKGGPKGYVYILFECEKSVKELLKQCTHDYSNGGEYYYKMSSKRMRCKEVQVIPWVLTDSNFIRCPSQRLDPQKTVFVGALHGMLNSEALAYIFNDLFGGVVYAGVDTDKHKYPIGSGRVTFNNNKSFMKAVNAAFIEVKTTKFTKKIQVDPYLEDSPCCLCSTGAPGPYFCRELQCFKYYCRPCWIWQHSSESFRQHKPLMRNSKTPSGFGVGNAFGGLAAGTLGQLMAGMTTFSSPNREEREEYQGVGEGTEAAAHPHHASFPTAHDDAYAVATSGYEHAYVNALCAELSNIMQFSNNNKQDQIIDTGGATADSVTRGGGGAGGGGGSGAAAAAAAATVVSATAPASSSAASGYRPTSVHDLFSSAAAAASRTYS